MTKTVSVKKRESGWFRRDWRLYVMLILPVAFYLIFCYKPMIGLVIAFQKYNMFKGMWGSKWVGLDNFKFVMNMPDFPVALKNTLWLNFLGLIAGFPVPIILAILLNELKCLPFKKVLHKHHWKPCHAERLSSLFLVGVLMISLMKSMVLYVRILQSKT